MEILYIIVAILVVYFFGSAIKAVLEGLGEMSAKEFDYHKDSQKLRLAKDYDNLGKRLEQMDITHSKASVRSLLDALESTDKEEA